MRQLDDRRLLRRAIRLAAWSAALMLVWCVAPHVGQVVAQGVAREKGAQIYLPLEKAPQTVLPEADSWERQEIRLTPQQLAEAKKLAAPAMPTIWETSFVSFIGKKAGKIVGYAVVCEEIGKHRPITFIVSAGVDGQVRDTAIMTYREPIGGEVRQKKFLDQFADKKLQDPIMPHKDIRNISGATMSVQALSRGVRKALAVMKMAYGI